MRAGIAWGQHRLELDIDEHNLVRAARADIAPDLADPIQAMRDALEHPLDYPALRLALIPDDHVAIVVDEGIPRLAQLLVPLLEHIRQANVHMDAVTLICPPSSSGQPWLDDLPDEFQDVHIEVHQPGDRKKLAYLATTEDERRIYLNRTAVDADQLVVMTRRGYDPMVGYAGAETAVYPGLSDRATIGDAGAELDAEPPGATPWPIQREAREVVWRLGAPFFVQIVAGSGDAIAHILCGPLESSSAGEQLLNTRWRVEFDQQADVAIASVTGTDATFDDLARAFFAAARVVKPGGSIVVLSDVAPQLTPAFEVLRGHDDPGQVLPLLQRERPAGLGAAFEWATAANQARLYLLSGLPADVAEELFTIPLDHAEQAQKLLTAQATCVLLPDAHRTLAVVR